MANTTKENVLAIAPELSEISDPTFDLILSDVDREVGTRYSTMQEEAQRYLAAHKLTVSNPGDASRNPRAAGPIVSHKVGAETVNFGRAKGADDVLSTSYGRRFNALRKMATAGGMVVTPGGS